MSVVKVASVVIYSSGFRFFIFTINLVFYKNKLLLYSKTNAIFCLKQFIHLLTVYFLALSLSKLFKLESEDLNLTKTIIYTLLTGILAFSFYLMSSLFILKINDIRTLIFGILSIVTNNKYLNKNYV